MAVYPGIITARWNTRARSPRRVRPFILAAVHITGNPRLPSALQEADYANRVGSGASFHFVVNRNGTVVQCLDPVSTVAWTNGNWWNPNWKLSTVVRAVQQGYGANDSTFMTIENVGYEPGYSISSQQKEALAHLIAWGSRVSGIPIVRVNVLGHRDYDSVTRAYCPSRYGIEPLLSGVIYRARQIFSPRPQPPATIPKGRDLYEWVATMKHQIPKKAIVRKGTVLYKDKVGGVKHYTLLDNTEIEVLGGTPGGWASRRKGGTGLFITPSGGILKWMPW